MNNRQFWRMLRHSAALAFAVRRPGVRGWFRSAVTAGQVAGTLLVCRYLLVDQRMPCVAVIPNGYWARLRLTPGERWYLAQWATIQPDDSGLLGVRYADQIVRQYLAHRAPPLSYILIGKNC